MLYYVRLLVDARLLKGLHSALNRGQRGPFHFGCGAAAFLD
jgi:hypothetical protein